MDEEVDAKEEMIVVKEGNEEKKDAPDGKLSTVDRSEAIEQIKQIGYTEERAIKALDICNNVEAALNWLINNDTDVDVDKQVKTAKSIKCMETGKLFRTMADAMIYAERTGHANFEETDEEIPPLTDAEKLERINKVKSLIKEKIAKKALDEKKYQQEQEKKRRMEGQGMAKVKEEYEIMQRKRDAEAREREKKRFDAEKQKLREQVARDKAERAMEKVTRMGGDAKAAKEAYDAAYGKAIGAGNEEKPTEEIAQAAITVLLAHNVNNRGVEALRTIKKMLLNVKNSPGEGKFRKINLKNETFHGKVGSLSGSITLFKASGFVKEEGEESSFLVLSMEDNLEKLNKVLNCLEKEVN